MNFAIDKIAVGILLGGLFLFGLVKSIFFSHPTSPSLSFSRIKDFNLSSWRSRMVSLPSQLHQAALLCFIIAFIDPHFLIPSSSFSQRQQLSTHEISKIPTEGIAIYLVLDQSGSMAQSVVASGKSISKIDLLKKVTKQFILDHPSDLIGLVSFARVPRVRVPLTLDQPALLAQLNQIEAVKNPEEDGTAIGYAIYKTAHLIAATRHFANQADQAGKPPYTIKSAIIIVVTDGFQDPSRLDQGNRLRTMELDDAAAYTKSQNIHLYVVNIDPALATAQYAPQRRQLQAITALTGGKFELVSNTQELQDIYASIDRLEKGTISKKAQLSSSESPSPGIRFSLYPFFIALGLLSLFSAVFLDSFVLKVVP